MIAKAVKAFFNNKLIQNLNNSNKTKIFIYPNLNGLGSGLFVFFCFLISVFYENNFGLLLSIIIFFVFFISIFISHQNLSHINFNETTEYFIEADKNENLNLNIVNLSNEKKLNIDIDYDNKIIGNFNFLKRNNKFNLVLKYRERGIYSFKKFCLKSIYPFGIIRTKMYFKLNSSLYVYPKLIQPSDDLLNEFNINNKNNANHDFDGIEEFKRGDSFSKIAWKKSIISDKKYVKNFMDPQKDLKLLLDLNQYSKIPFELLLSYATYIVQFYFNKKIDLTVKHKDNIFYLKSNRSSLNQILKYFANVQS